VQRGVQALFGEVDVVVTPTAAIGALAYDEHDQLPSLDSLIDHMFTQYWNATGNPALSIPMGFTADGLPLSLQVAGRPFDEALTLKVGDAYQGVTGWHLELPPLVRRLAATV
jgi:aspartyl-tRNA(Asn)/glutamyl-tRNA(Gln) amidotransferase subunit A